MKFADITGQRFGRLSVVRREGSIGAGFAAWKCQCDCGNEVLVDVGRLRAGRTRSCGCLARECAAARKRTHGMTGSRAYKTWVMMIQRCTNPRYPNYKNYGARGITVCQRWRESFEAFLADMGNRPSGLTLDRKDNDGHYEPGNCRWADALTQVRNRRPRDRWGEGASH